MQVCSECEITDIASLVAAAKRPPAFMRVRQAPTVTP
jgi:hypothetical protein